MTSLSLLIDYVLMTVLFGLGILFLAACLRSFWNKAMPQAFGLKPVGYWQAFYVLMIEILLVTTALLTVNYAQALSKRTHAAQQKLSKTAVQTDAPASPR